MSEIPLDARLLQQLSRYVQSRITNSDDAQDVVQQVLLKAVTRGAPAAPQPLANWLFAVARNQVIDHLRTRTPGHSELNTVVEVLPQESTTGDGPERQLQQALGRSVVVLITTLKAEDQTLLRAIDLEGESQKAYAARTALKYSTLKSRLQRARRRLRAALDACCELSIDRRGTPISCVSRDEQGCC